MGLFVQRIEYRGFNDALLSLRGIAAFLVLVFHAVCTFKVSEVQPFFASFPPLVSVDLAATVRQWILLLTNGHAAVVFFFVHSGFVLTLAFSRSGIEGRIGLGTVLPAYYVKRLFRLWPTIILACLLMFFYQRSGFPPGIGDAYSDWFRELLPEKRGLQNLRSNILLARFNLNPFLWSLAIEVIGSILLPVFYLMGRRIFTTYLLILAFYTLMVAWPAGYAPEIWKWSFVPLRFQFVFCMAIGVIVAFSYDTLSRLSLPIGRNAIIATAIVVLLGARWVMPISLSLVVESLASSVIIFIVYYFQEGPVQRFCNLRIVKFYGAISYSFYLMSLFSIHVAGIVVADTLGHEFLAGHGLLGVVLVFVFALAICTPLSWLSYSVVERPFMRLGRQLAARITGPQSREQQVAAD